MGVYRLSRLLTNSSGQAIMSSRLIFGSAAAAAAGYIIYEYQHQNEKQRQSIVSVPADSQRQEGRNPRQQRQEEPGTSRWVTERVENNKPPQITEGLEQEGVKRGDGLQDDAWTRVKNGVSEDIACIRDALLGRGSQHRSGESDISHSIFNWSFNDAERDKAIAIGEYDRAKKNLSSAQDQWAQSKKGVFDSGDPELKQEVEILKDVMNEKKKRLDEASEKYASFTQNNFNEISDGLDAQDEKIRKEGGFFRWLTRSPPEKDEIEEEVIVDPTDEVATSTLAGFGENAYFFSQEQIKDRLRHNEIGPSEAQQRLDELKRIKDQGWMKYTKGPESEESIAKNASMSLQGWGDTAADLAREELDEARRRFQKRIESRDDAAKAMDDAAARVQDAKKQVDKTGSSWWQGTKQESDEQHEQARRAFDQAVHDYEKAKKVFDSWHDKNTGKFWSSADGSVRAMRRKELLGDEKQDSALQEQLLEE